MHRVGARALRHLERVEIVIEPEELAEHAGKQKVLIGEDVSERLDVVPVKFHVIVTRRPKYAFKNADGVIQAPAPAHIIEGGIPTRLRSWLRNAPVSCATRKLSASNSSSLSPSRLRQWLRSERSCGNAC
ncbi:hypothetical protein J2R96_002325 [Bradyrhizobium elkanii]|nr:hypothetical protein [Bradyrhizobium elkanii]